MAILRPIGARPPAEPGKAQAHVQQEDDGYQPPVLQVSRLRDAAEVALVGRIHAKLAPIIGQAMETASTESIRALLTEHFPLILEEEHVVVSRADRIRLQDAVLAEIVGYGPIQDLIMDDTLTEVMVNGSRQVWIERAGKLYMTDIAFADDGHVLRIIQRIVAPLGRRCDESSPMVDARLPDGSRVNAIIPPLSLVGPVLTIRKFRRTPLSPDELVQNGSVSAEALEFLHACVRGRLNVIVAGGTGAGKTTLLNVLSSFISPRERIVTIEDAAELRLQQVHVIPLETRPPNIESGGGIAIRDLFRNALRMRPDRIVIGECRGPEALDMLQAMNTGHDGSLTTIHSNGPRDALSRIETMVLMSGADLPLRAIREQVASAVNLVVYVERLQDGTRKITQVSEVRGMENETITMQDIFVFRAAGIDNGRIVGELRPTGIRPSFSDQLMERGIELPSSWFGYDGRLA